MKELSLRRGLNIYPSSYSHVYFEKKSHHSETFAASTLQPSKRMGSAYLFSSTWAHSSIFSFVLVKALTTGYREEIRDVKHDNLLGLGDLTVAELGEWEEDRIKLLYLLRGDVEAWRLSLSDGR